VFVESSLYLSTLDTKNLKTNNDPLKQQNGASKEIRIPLTIFYSNGVYLSSPLYGKNVANVIYYSTGDAPQSLSVAMHYAEQSVEQDPVSQYGSVRGIHLGNAQPDVKPRNMQADWKAEIMLTDQKENASPRFARVMLVGDVLGIRIRCY